MKNLKYVMTLVALVGLMITGCAKDAEEAKKPVGTDSGHSSHDHDHIHGPFGGEVFVMEDAGVTIECVAKYGDNLIMFYCYEDDIKTARKIKCDKIAGSFSAGEVKTVEIPATDLGDDGMASKFEIVDETFAIAMKTTGANLEVEIDGVKHSTKLDKDPHAH